MSDQTLAEQHAAAAAYITWLSSPTGTPRPTATAETSGNVPDGWSHGGGETHGG
jgi:hypothetical protein